MLASDITYPALFPPLFQDSGKGDSYYSTPSPDPTDYWSELDFSSDERDPTPSPTLRRNNWSSGRSFKNNKVSPGVPRTHSVPPGDAQTTSIADIQRQRKTASEPHDTKYRNWRARARWRHLNLAQKILLQRRANKPVSHNREWGWNW